MGLKIVVMDMIANNIINRNGTAGTYAGVRIEGASSTSNAITHNSISLNSGLGIQLLSGGNAELAAPILNFVSFNTVAGVTCPDCCVQIYSDTEDEGAIYEVDITADGTGYFYYSDASLALSGPNITAITFDLIGNTSQFSSPVVLFSARSYLPLVQR